MLRKPWPVISSLAYPSRLGPAFTVFSLIGRPFVREPGKKGVAPRAGECMQLAQDCDGLRGEGNDVLFAHLHALGRDAPLHGVELEIRPFIMRRQGTSLDPYGRSIGGGGGNRTRVRKP